jgi:hypothetical protein
MKRRACITVLLIILAAAVFAQEANNPQPAAVPDEATAIKLGEKILERIYGRKQIQSEKPFTAKLTDGVWHVTGTLYCKDKNRNLVSDVCVGGVAMADVRQRDGRVLKTAHSQ